MPLQRTRSDGQAFKPGRRGDRSNASTQRGGYSATSSRRPPRPSPRILSSFPALTRIPPGLLALSGLPVHLASSHAARFLRDYVFAYTSAPCCTNSRDFSSKPLSMASSFVRPCSAAYLRTSSVIFIEQKCGPHIEQKCAVFAPSCGNSFVVELTQVLPALSPSRVFPSMSPPARSAPFTRV